MLLCCAFAPVLSLASLPLDLPDRARNTEDAVPGYVTPDGDYISHEEGEATLRTGLALVIGDLWIGLNELSR
ncbi:hypothetical protein [Hymenobacter sp. YC55]|uniref:hypothetical protein n=1 Tax=Hymenobacter sp. YC55 TaxID=3034019 RepID=UPI0023FA360B|nr:hypothetical protein [Hymenobacter sp. YC55]MDF7814005.1 hypothetical protein [Hymenobacter sp. YC55]